MNLIRNAFDSISKYIYNNQEEIDDDDYGEIIINDNIEPDEINFNDYLPVFLYSHAEYPTLPHLDVGKYPGTRSMFVQPNKRGKIKQTKKRQELFTEVPDNVIVVDPIIKGKLCNSTKSIDYGFVDFILKNGNSSFLENKSFLKAYNNYSKNSSPIKKKKTKKRTKSKRRKSKTKKEEEKNKDLKLIKTFHNNKKVYFSGSTINNFSIVFDVNKKGYEYKIPWKIRYKNPIRGKEQTIPIDRKYNLYRESDTNPKRILLEDTIEIIIEELNNVTGLEEYKDENGNVKFVLYLISCRGGDTKETEDKKIYVGQEQVKKNGENGTYFINKRKTKREVSFEKGYVYSTPSPTPSISSSLESVASIGGGKKKTRKKKYRKKRGGGSLFKIMSWNILASVAVKYHKKNSEEEKEKERGLRHDAIIRKIELEDPDVILLQEFDRHFMEKIKGKYEIITKFPMENVNSFTTAVLYKNDKFENDNDSKLLYDEETETYDKKNAMRADLTFKANGKKIRFISLHLSGRKEKARTRLLNYIIKDIKKVEKNKIGIYGGDFNQVLSNTDENYSTCSFDYADEKEGKEGKKVLIDKIVYPNTHIKMKSYKVDKEPCNDGDKNDKDKFEFSQFNGSDHFPIVAEFMFIENESKNESKKKSKKKSKTESKTKSKKSVKK